MENTSFITQIQDLIANGELDQALQKLQLLLKDSPKLNEAIHQSGRFSDLQAQIRLGIIDHQAAALSKNQVSWSLLELLNELEGKGSDEGIKMAASKTEVIQKAEKIYNISHIDNANFS